MVASRKNPTWRRQDSQRARGKRPTSGEPQMKEIASPSCSAAATGAGAAVLPTEDPMTLALVQQLDWTERQRTDGYTLLVAP